MLQIIIIIIGIINILIANFGKQWVFWIILGVVNSYLIFSFYSLKLSAERVLLKIKAEEHLTLPAFNLFSSFPHYFMMPFACRDACASCATNQWVGVILAIIGLIKGFWIGVILGIINWFIMGKYACSFAPIALLHHNPSLIPFHDEVM